MRFTPMKRAVGTGVSVVSCRRADPARSMASQLGPFLFHQIHSEQKRTGIRAERRLLITDPQKGRP